MEKLAKRTAAFAMTAALTLTSAAVPTNVTASLLGNNVCFADETASEKQEQHISAPYLISHPHASFCTVNIENVEEDGGELTIESADPDIVSVRITDGVVYLYFNNVGTTTINITAAETDKYKQATASIEVNCKVRAITPIILEIEDQEYTGEPIEPTLDVVYKDYVDDDVHIDPSLYDVEYSNNIEVGTATVTVTLKEGHNNSGSATATFNIVKTDSSSDTSSAVSEDSVSSSDTSSETNTSSEDDTSSISNNTSNIAESSSASGMTSSTASTSSTAKASSTDTNPKTGLQAAGTALALVLLGTLTVARKKK